MSFTPACHTRRPHTPGSESDSQSPSPSPIQSNLPPPVFTPLPVSDRKSTTQNTNTNASTGFVLLCRPRSMGTLIYLFTRLFRFPPYDAEPNPFFVDPSMDHRMFQQMMEQTDRLIHGFSPDLSSSPSFYPLTQISRTNLRNFESPAPGNPLHSTMVHSPQPQYPSSRSLSTSVSTSTFPGFEVLGLNPSSSDIHSILPPSQQSSAGPEIPPHPVEVPSNSNVRPQSGHGSLAYIRGRTPAPPTSAAIYIGFPFHPNPARSGFFEPNVPISSPTPRLSDLLRAITSLGRVCSEVLNEICAQPTSANYRVAWSRTMVEVHDSTYSAIVHGYYEVGALHESVQSSAALIPCADHNNTSRCIFGWNGLDLVTPLFVLYVFPERVPAPAAAQQPIILQPATGHQRRSDTPAPPTGNADSIALAPFLPKLLRATVILDESFTTEGFQLTALLNSDYKSAYLQIRQALIINSIFLRRPASLFDLKRMDIALWAGFKPRTWVNMWTYATDARGILILLQNRASSDDVVGEQSIDIIQKERALREFLQGCFQAELLPTTWAVACGPVTYSMGQAVNPFREILKTYLPAVKLAQLKKLPFTTV
ncbi:hypothetical protein C8F04DRAFT_1359434 [Mycena alexandri]|uniref:Uncharacterized protein n=1 Tax=Mycena alexandri TaxID=1745969 RepID=A0AAD6X0M9_9AGAR|nr:hypothetical protein C8F04DRAFT_1359434 [Mycena alexandri]